MSWARAMSRGRFLKARLGVKPIQKASRLLGEGSQPAMETFSGLFMIWTFGAFGGHYQSPGPGPNARRRVSDGQTELWVGAAQPARPAAGSSRRCRWTMK